MQNVEWLQLLIKTWQLMSGFRIFKKFTTSLPVTNNSAEKNINLPKIFFNMSNNKEKWQVLFLVVKYIKK